MIMTQFIDLKMKNSGKLEETKPRTDSGRHRYMGRGITRTGGSCGAKLVTNTDHKVVIVRRGTMSSISIGSRASPFRSGHTDSQGRHVHGIK